MGDKTGIEWADATWSPVTGCTRVSDGCLNCYIERSTPIRIAGRRFDGEGIGSSLAVQLHPNRLDWPIRKRDGKKIFVCSQADLFHDDVPDEYIARVFAVMALAPQHTFQVLTKRHGRMRSLLSSDDFRSEVTQTFVGWAVEDLSLKTGHLESATGDRWPLPNVWLGVSAEDQKRADLRIPALLDTPAAVRWISAEPLLGPVNLHTDPIEAGTPSIGATTSGCRTARSTRSCWHVSARPRWPLAASNRLSVSSVGVTTARRKYDDSSTNTTPSSPSSWPPPRPCARGAQQPQAGLPSTTTALATRHAETQGTA